MPGCVNTPASWLLQLGNDQVGRDRLCAAGGGSDDQCCRVVGRVADGQSGSGNSGGHQSHAGKLTGSGGAAKHSVWQLVTVQRQHQLTGLRYADHKQHLIGARDQQIKAAGAAADDTAAAGWAVLREIHIRAGGNGVGVVRGHQGIEVCEGQYSSCRPGLTHGPLRTDWSGLSHRALRTGRPGLTHGALRTGRPGCTYGALRTGRPGFTHGPLRTDRPGLTYGPLRTGRSGCTYGPLRTGRPGSAHGPLGTDRPGCTGGTGFSHGALRTDRSGRACRPLRTYRTLLSGRSLRAYWPFHTGDALGTGRSSWSGNALRPLWALWASWPGRAWPAAACSRLAAALQRAMPLAIAVAVADLVGILIEIRVTVHCNTSL